MPFFIASLGAFLIKLGTFGTVTAKSFVLAKVVGYAAISAGLTSLNYGLGRLLAKDPSLGEAATRTVRSAVTPRRWVLGRQMVGGLLCYIGARSNRARLAFVLSDDETDAIEAIRIHGETIKISQTGGRAYFEPNPALSLIHI